MTGLSDNGSIFGFAFLALPLAGGAVGLALLGGALAGRAPAAASFIFLAASRAGSGVPMAWCRLLCGVEG